MHKMLNIALTIFLILLIFMEAQAADKRIMALRKEPLSRRQKFQQTNTAEGKGGAFYDLGVFAYEDSQYEEAENNLKEAVRYNPENPLYNHYLGKTYMKMGDYQAAENYLNLAWRLNPNIPELKYDLASLNYAMANYSEAAKLFLEITKDDPSNVFAYYHAGINLYEQRLYKKALVYFIHAAQESPSIKTNSYYYIGICYLKTGKTKEALEKFEYVRDHAEEGPLKENAMEWIKAAKRQEKVVKPYRIYLKINYQYDDHVRHKFEDLDVYKEEDSYFYFSGKYDFFNRNDFQMGAGYNHYQTLNNDAEEYDLTGSILNLYLQHRFHSYTFKFSYLPSYYWLDSNSYLMHQHLKPEIMRKFNEKLMAKISYSYYRNNYFQDDDRDGHTNEIFLDAYYTIGDQKGYLFTGVGFENNTASHSDHNYGQLKTKLGISLKIPWKMKLGLMAKYYDKKYKNIDSYFGVKREDMKYYGSISLSQKLFYAWLDIVAEFNYTQNDSNIDEYEYTRRVTSLALTASY